MLRQTNKQLKIIEVHKENVLPIQQQNNASNIENQQAKAEDSLFLQDQKKLLLEIEQLKSSLKTISKTRDYYKRIFLCLKDVALVLSLNGTVEFISPSVREFAGYEPEEVIGTHIGKYFADQEEFHYISKILEAMLISKKSLKPVEFLLNSKISTPFYVKAWGHINYKNSKPVAVELILRNIEKRKKAEIKLKEYEERYREFFDNLPGFAFTHDLKGNILDANLALKEIFDYYGIELDNEFSISQLIPEKNHPEIFKYLERVEKNGKDEDRLEFVLPDGQKRLFVYNVFLVKNPQGAMVVSGYLLDITEPYKIKRKLKEREKFYKSIFENSGTCIFILNEDFLISSINLKASDLLGHPKEEIEGKANLFNFFTPEYKKRHLKNGTFLKTFADEESLKFDATLVDRDGNIHSMLINTRHIPGTRKMVASAVEISNPKKAQEMLKKTRMDLEILVEKRTKELLQTNTLLNEKIRHRDKALEKLQQNEFKYRQSFENTDIAMIIVNQDGTITKMNESYLDLLGYAREEVQGKKWTEAIHPDDCSYADSIWVNLLNCPNEKYNVEFKILKKDGNVAHVLGHVTAIQEPDQILVIGSFSDITHLKRTEEALIQNQKRLAVLMNDMPGMAYRINIKNNSFEFFSEGCKRVTGFTAAYLLDPAGKNYTDLIHPEDRESFNIQIEEAFQSNSPFQIKYRIENATKKNKWVLQTGQRIISETGEPISIDGIILDAAKYLRNEQDLVDENFRPKSNIKEFSRFGNIIGKSHPMQNIYKLILKASDSDNHVIVYGESGTGKELVAKAIHDYSERRDKAFVPVNCGAIPENLVESEFFGYKKGAFTGAVQNKKGLFAEADGGTLFLDEIGEIPLNMQVKLLRAIEGGGYTPVGANQVINSDVRIIGATSRNLLKLIQEGKIREDFYYRIHIIPVHLPPLRERIEDLPLLIEHFLKPYGIGDIQEIPFEILDKFKTHNWRGNIRELQNVLYRYMTLGTIEFMPHIQNTDVSAPKTTLNTSDPIIPSINDQQNLRTIICETEKRVILNQLKKNSWNKSQTAIKLQIDRKTLIKKIKTYALIP